MRSCPDKFKPGLDQRSVFRSAPLPCLAEARDEPRAGADRPRGILRSRWDLLLVALAFAHGALLLWAPSVWLIGLGMWWNANTISHNFIHRPFFRPGLMNGVFSAFLSLLLGVPQTLWRDRHRAHHANRPWEWRCSRALFRELGLLAFLWGILLWNAPQFFLVTYLPGVGLGLGLCFLQGYYEHAGGTKSHYSSIYNLLFFNDGYHSEHHLRPGVHWRKLPGLKTENGLASPWPPVLRWLGRLNLEGLEKCVLRSQWLQRFVLRTHRGAICRLLSAQSGIHNVGIVGGGLFPRTALVLRELLPNAALTIIEANGENLETAKKYLPREISFEQRWFEGNAERQFDLVVVPLAFIGDRGRIYKDPPASIVLIHDWIWRKRGDQSAVISWLLLKRVNLVRAS